MSGDLERRSCAYVVFRFRREIPGVLFCDQLLINFPASVRTSSSSSSRRAAVSSRSRWRVNDSISPGSPCGNSIDPRASLFTYKLSPNVRFACHPLADASRSPARIRALRFRWPLYKGVFKNCGTLAEIVSANGYCKNVPPTDNSSVLVLLFRFPLHVQIIETAFYPPRHSTPIVPLTILLSRRCLLSVKAARVDYDLLESFFIVLARRSIEK